MLLSELRRTSRIKGLKIKVAELLTLCGIKHAELLPAQQKYKVKGSTVYRGDYITDESRSLVLFQDTATTPMALPALSISLWFGCLEDSSISCSNAVRAYLQAPLEDDTWVVLPYELWTEDMCNKSPSTAKIAVRLLKSLCGHPLVGKLWQDHLSERLQALGGSSWPSTHPIGFFA